MSLTPSAMKPLGTPAPDFALPDCEGRTVSRRDFAGQPLLVAFICNHCPFVQHIGEKLGELTAEYTEKGLGVVLINSNSSESHPEDGPDKMPDFIRRYGILVPYLHDASQNTAKTYKAACTPDFFLFDAQHQLVYRGQFDEARPGNNHPITGADLSSAVDAVLNNTPVPEDQKPSMGCNIKWEAGKEPDYFSH